MEQLPPGRHSAMTLGAHRQDQPDSVGTRIELPPPRTLRRPCESCGGPPGPTVFLPNGLGGGRRVCRTCLALIDTVPSRQNG